MACNVNVLLFVLAMYCTLPFILRAADSLVTVPEDGSTNLTVVAGETARFACDLEQVNDHDVIYWLFEKDCFLYISRNDMIRNTCGINMKHYRIEVDSVKHIYTLEIDNVSEDDAGKYVCLNESQRLVSVELVVLPRPTYPSPVLVGGCAERVRCELSYYPTGLAPSSEMEAQASCYWSETYNDMDIHVHMYCDGLEIIGNNKLLLSNHAIGKVEPSRQSGCSNFTCNLEIVGESGIRDTCTIYSKNPNQLQQVVLRVEPELNFVEEGFDAIFFCHISNAQPKNGFFRWYITHANRYSVNSASSDPVASTTGFYGKLEMSAVKLVDDFTTVECEFEPDDDTNYPMTASNPAVLRVIRRSATQVSCSTGSTSSLLECTDHTEDKHDEKKNYSSIWPLSVTEWLLVGTSLVLLVVVIMLCRSASQKSPKERRGRRNYHEYDSALPNNGVHSSDLQHHNRRYEYLTERTYDEPYSILRSIRNIPRRFRNRVIHRYYAASTFPRNPPTAPDGGSPNQTYGSIDPEFVHVRLRDRVVSRSTDITDDEPGQRNSSDYDVLDATTMNDTASPPSSPVDRPMTLIAEQDIPSCSDNASAPNTSSPPTTRHRPATAKKPKVAPRPLSPKPQKPNSMRIPSISGDIDNYGGVPTYVNTSNVDDDYAIPAPRSVVTQPQQRTDHEGYLQPNEERWSDYQTIC